MRLPVNSKEDFIVRYLHGEFGNRPKTWLDLESFKGEATPNKLYHVRIAIKGYPKTFYNVPYENVEKVWNEATNLVGKDKLYISEMGPEDKKVFQGEIVQSPTLFLKYNLLAMPMREAFEREVFYATGLNAKLLIRRYFDINSYEWLEYLLENYPNHVVEFSTYAVCWGTLGWNTVFWEVRNY